MDERGHLLQRPRRTLRTILSLTSSGHDALWEVRLQTSVEVSRVLERALNDARRAGESLTNLCLTNPARVLKDEPPLPVPPLPPEMGLWGRMKGILERVEDAVMNSQRFTKDTLEEELTACDAQVLSPNYLPRGGIHATQL